MPFSLNIYGDSRETYPAAVAEGWQQRPLGYMRDAVRKEVPNILIVAKAICCQAGAEGGEKTGPLASTVLSKYERPSMGGGSCEWLEWVATGSRREETSKG